LLVRVPDVKLRAVTTDPLFAWRFLTPRVSLVEGNGANSVVIADGRDVLLVDTKETGFGGALRAEVERVVGHPVTCVVSTHHHTDHAMGNIAFTAEVPVIAQRRARERTVARAARALVEMATAAEQGDDPFEARVADLHDWAEYFGHVRSDHGVRSEFQGLVERAREAVRIVVELHHWGPGHTDGDVVVALPSEGIVIAADLVYVGLQPFVDVGTGGRTDGWMRRLDDLLALCGRVARDGRPAVVVPGHGAPAGPEAVATQRAYFDRLYEAVDHARRSGSSRADTVRLVPPGLPAARAELLGANLGLVFDEMAEPADQEIFSCQPE
jgi:cyclase